MLVKRTSRAFGGETNETLPSDGGPLSIKKRKRKICDFGCHCDARNLPPDLNFKSLNPGSGTHHNNDAKRAHTTQRKPDHHHNAQRRQRHPFNQVCTNSSIDDEIDGNKKISSSRTKMNSNKDATTTTTNMMDDNDNDMSTTTDDDEEPLQRFDPNLVRKLLQFRPAQTCNNNQQNQFQSMMHPPPRISNEAVLAAGELLRLFVLETRHRASIDAECEQEGDNFMQNTTSTTNNMTSQNSCSGSNNKKNSMQQQEDGTVQIRSDHVTKVAAEMLMDFA